MPAAAPTTLPAPARHRILVATYACIARTGLARLTVEEAAREAGVSRATVYRHFPGGRDELVREAVAHEVAHFFLDLATAVEGETSVDAVLEQALLHAHAAVADHDVLQELLANEPGRLLPSLTVGAHRLLPPIAGFIAPHLAAAGLRAGTEVAPAAEYVARMVLSLVGAPGRWDLSDRTTVRELVRSELLAGIVAGVEPAVGWGPGPDSAPEPPAPDPPAGAGGGGPRPVPTDPDGVERRILDGALRALGRWGVARSSLDDIAKEAGCSRATVYRAFPGGKDTLLEAVVADEVARFATGLRARLADADTVEDVLQAGITFAAHALSGHEVLRLLLAHEPEQVLPHVSFGRLDRLLAMAAQLVAPHLSSFVGNEVALRTGEWVTRLVLSCTMSPSPAFDLTDPGNVRRLVTGHVLPGLGVHPAPAPPGGRPTGVEGDRW